MGWLTRLFGRQERPAKPRVLSPEEVDFECRGYLAGQWRITTLSDEALVRLMELPDQPVRSEHARRIQ